MKNHLLKKYKLFIFIGLAISGLVGVEFILNDDLRPRHLISPYPYHPEWETARLLKQEGEWLNQILNQTFTYLGEGGQAAVFVSKDQRYVLKFFKFKRFLPAFWTTLLPPWGMFQSYYDQHREKREQKWLAACHGYKLAYDLHRQESGLRFVQLNPEEKTRCLTVIDKWHLQRTIDLSHVPYVIQERGEVLSDVLTRLYDKGDLGEVKSLLMKLFDLYLAGYRKGIRDLDHGIMHNIAYVNDHLIHLDVGKFVKEERPEVHREDLAKVANKLRTWVKHRYPNYLQELELWIKEKCHE